MEPDTARTFSFESSQPVGVVTLRGHLNERSEFLLATIPVTDLDRPPEGTQAFPHFASGNGWGSRIVLTNPADAPASGAAVIVEGNSAEETQLDYEIAPRSATTLVLPPENAETIRSAQVRVIPDPNTSAPDGVLIFSFEANGVTVTTAGVPFAGPSAELRTYVDSTAGGTGLALANADSMPVSLSIRIADSNGTIYPASAAILLPAATQRTFFLRQLPEFESLPASFEGVLIVTSDRPVVAMTALRGTYNVRGDFLISTLPVIDVPAPAETTLFVPHFAQGGGYRTRFLVFKGTASDVSGSLTVFDQNGAPLNWLLPQ
jgi:hypothetical protein